ncbi:hypothetical protein [Streptomyces pseudogriseolus]|uniref:hypothetical protein n=1 Tax=Streptomyces pseudogriseolus TaxID=36817 RepID=UPI003FA2A0F9
MSLLHQPHPWIGRDVEDTATGRRGILRAIAPDLNGTKPVAWLHPRGGGPEWNTDPKALADPAAAPPPGGPGGKPGSSPARPSH